MSPAPSYGLDWFEGAIAQPDKVLQDFIHAVNPSNSSVRPSTSRGLSSNEAGSLFYARLRNTLTTGQHCCCMQAWGKAMSNEMLRADA